MKGFRVAGFFSRQIDAIVDPEQAFIRCGQPVAFKAFRLFVLDVNGQRTIVVILKVSVAITNGVSVDFIVDQLEVGAVHGQRPEALVLKLGDFTLFEMQNIFL